jgi:hypothetical protein
MNTQKSSDSRRFLLFPKLNGEEIIFKPAQFLADSAGIMQTAQDGSRE